jgi:sterol desaturase/sphingolipid hydroxylase (fatty acid hydroxylase superfamily)
LYQFHKKHHLFKQDNSPVASSFASVVESLILDTFPIFLGFYVLRFHWIQTNLFLALRVWEACDAHSQFDFSFPWGWGSAKLHQLHHTKNTGNYSIFVEIWDAALGTKIK